MTRLTHRFTATHVDGSRLLGRAAAFLLIGLAAGPASAGRTPRTGPTIEAGGSLAEVWHTYADRPRSLTGIGHFGAGAFVHPKVAILLRFAALPVMLQPASFTSHFGVDVQWWPTSSLFVAAGGGAAYWHTFRAERDPMSGIGATARAGWAFVERRRTTVRVGVEVLPTWFRGGHSSTAVALVIDWQRL
ncbi:MAG: hypothetical protein HYV09_36240 [Deltaproteobacteria bacterium]|nr:hypothetical protein [Deltaproteobacteria bacterium]